MKEWTRRSGVGDRPLNIVTQKPKNVADKGDNENGQTSASASVVVPNEVRIMKSSLVKNKRSGKTSKGKRSKKRVRFSDSEPSPPAEGTTLCERFVRFFHFLWKNTRSSVRNVISEFPSF